MSWCILLVVEMVGGEEDGFAVEYDLVCKGWSHLTASVREKSNLAQHTKIFRLKAFFSTSYLI